MPFWNLKTRGSTRARERGQFAYIGSKTNARRAIIVNSFTFGMRKKSHHAAFSRRMVLATREKNAHLNMSEETQ